jgi:hypothetical protein
MAPQRLRQQPGVGPPRGPDAVEREGETVDTSKGIGKGIPVNGGTALQNGAVYVEEKESRRDGSLPYNPSDTLAPPRTRP